MKKVVAYSVVFLGLLFAYRYFLYVGVKKNKAGVFNKYNELFENNNNNFNVLFLGSSRAEMHFDTQVFDDITGQNSYNLGMSGAWPKMSFTVLKTYCQQHKKPTHLIYAIDYFWLQNENDKLQNCANLFPYFNNNYLLKNLNAIDGRCYFFYANPLQSLPHTQLNFLSASLHGWFNIAGKYDTLWHKGFYKNVIAESVADFVETESDYINIVNRNYTDSIIQFSKKNNIKLCLVAAPISSGALKNNAYKTKLSNSIKNVAVINNLPFIDYTDSTICAQPNYFSDKFHLNYQGAQKFTTSFALYFKLRQ